MLNMLSLFIDDSKRVPGEDVIKESFLPDSMALVVLGKKKYYANYYQGLNSTSIPHKILFLFYNVTLHFRMIFPEKREIRSVIMRP